MLTSTWFLIITMGSRVGISYAGFGGISVTPVQSLEQCESLKSVVEMQIKKTDYIYLDGDEIVIECKNIE